MGRMIVTALALCALAGCAPQAQGHWVHPELDNAQARPLAYDCSVVARSMHRGNGLAAEIYAQQEFASCMRSRGFLWVRN